MFSLSSSSLWLRKPGHVSNRSGDDNLSPLVLKKKYDMNSRLETKPKRSCPRVELAFFEKIVDASNQRGGDISSHWFLDPEEDLKPVCQRIAVEIYGHQTDI